MLIGLCYDLRSDYLAMGFLPEDVAEFDSDATIHELEAALQSLGYQTERIGHVRALCQRLTEGKRWDLVFNIAEGLKGRCREAQVPALLEAYDIPYTFSDPLASAVTLDKAFAKRLMAQANLSTPRHIIGATWEALCNHDLKYPLFVKPNGEGTGKGIDGRSCVADAEAYEKLCKELLTRFSGALLVEEYLPGREFTTGVIGNGPTARALGTMEIEVLHAPANSIYSYETKEECETMVRYSRLSEGPLHAAISQLAVEAFRVLECRDAARIDIRLDADGNPSCLEINCLPGLHPHHSDLPMIATWEKMPFKELIAAIVNHAKARYGLKDVSNFPVAPGPLTSQAI